MESLLIGCGAGFSGDRLDAAAPVVRTLIQRGGPAALMFEMLAERTLAAAQLLRRADASGGYEPTLKDELRPVLADCLRHGIVIVGNFGAANPAGAARAIIELATELQLDKPRVAVVEGDDLSSEDGQALLKKCLGAQDFESRAFVCANAYQGAFAIAEAIRAGAQVVVTGRVADPSLALGPAIAHFGWREDDLDCLAGATMAGHLLECGAQLTGGYFADPGKKDVPNMHDVGFPIAEVFEDGHCIVTKAAGTGGRISAASVIHDPCAYLTPDVVADIGEAQVRELGPDEVMLSGVRGHARTDTLKANVFFDNGWLGEAEISYAGPNARARAELAIDIVRKRLEGKMEMRFDMIGLVSIMGDDAGRLLSQAPDGGLPDVRVRVAGRHHQEAMIDLLHQEVTALWTGGPAGGGGVRVAKRPRLLLRSCLVPREQLPASFRLL
jgi:hypothetical protein